MPLNGMWIMRVPVAIWESSVLMWIGLPMPVLAVTAPKTLLYWPGDGIESTEVELPDGAQVQFFGSSPLVLLIGGEAGASVVSGKDLHPVQNQPHPPQPGNVWPGQQ